MSFKKSTVVLALMTAIAAPVPAWAFGGGAPGCSNLPDLYRAYGALEGLSTCDMTIEQASRIVAAYNGQQAQPAPRAHRGHRRTSQQ